MDKEPYVFISYSTKNQDCAEAARRLLIDEGIRCWMAPYDIPPGSRYAEVIVDAIRGCGCMLLLLTEAAQQSNFVYREVGRAVAYGKSIITMQLENIELNSRFELYLGEEQIVQVKCVDKENVEVKRALESIKTFINNTYDCTEPERMLSDCDERVKEILEELENGEDDFEWEEEWENDVSDNVTIFERFKNTGKIFDDEAVIEFDDSDEEQEEESNKKKPKGLWACGIVLLLFAVVTVCIAGNNLYLWKIVDNFEYFGYESEAIYSKVLAGFMVLHSALWLFGVLATVRIMLRKLYIPSVAMIVIMGIFTYMNFNNAAVVASRGKCTNEIKIHYCTEEDHYELLQNEGYYTGTVTVKRADEPMVDGEFYHMEYLVLTRKYEEEWEKVTKNMNLPEDAFAIYLPRENMRYSAMYGH